MADLQTGTKGQGGSTITQQVVKQTLLTTDKTITRKLKEWFLAIKLDESLPKDDILNMYLNTIPYGGNLYGIEEASRAYFGVSASDVDLAQAAYLASLPQAPTYYSPYGNHRDALDARKNLVLQKMLENGFISQDEYTQATQEVVSFLPAADRGIKAPHFTLYVKELLEKKYGKGEVARGGLNVITTLDVDLEQKAEEIVKKYALENEKNFNASNAAMVAVDPKTGAVRVMVGSRDYFDPNIQGNFNVALAHRQPGSSFKPFVYSEAFIKGYTPDTVVFDTKTEFSTECRPDGTPLYPTANCYNPVNYDDRFRGPITMKDALAQSLNIPAIKTLYLAGLKDSLALAERMGINGLGSIDQYGLTLVLGGGEVSLYDMTGAYAVFADQGVKNVPYVIQKVTDANGNVLEEHTPDPTTVLPKDIANTISDILSDDKAREPEYGLHSPLYLEGYDVAAKTGTTNDYRDAWILGYTPNLAVGAWAGNNDNSPMVKKIAGYVVAPMWHEFMQYALTKVEKESFDKPFYNYTEDLSLSPILRGEWQGGISYLIDTVSGKLATQYTPPETTTEREAGGVHSILYWLNKDNPRGGRPADPAVDPQFSHWEYSVEKWALTHGFSTSTSTSTIPTAYDDVHTPATIPHATLVSPQPNGSNSLQERLPVILSYQGNYPFLKAEYYLNNYFVGSSQNGITTFSFVPADVGGHQGENTLRVIVYDTVYNKQEISTVLNLN